MKKNNYWPSSKDPVWLEEGFRINESVFCESFILTHQIVFCNGFFFTEDGRVTDEMPLRSTIYAELRDYARVCFKTQHLCATRQCSKLRT